MNEQLGFFEQIGIKHTEPSEGKFAFIDLTSDNPHWIQSTSYENVSEHPTEENPTFLSEILEKKVNPKYYLSSKACEGILRRAEQRGKELPKVLKEALLGQAGCDDKTYSVDQGAGKSGANVMEECSPTLACTHGGAPAINAKSYGVVAKGNGDAFVQEEKHTTLSTGGGEPGQGYPCAITQEEDPDVAAFLYSSGKSAHGIAYDEEKSPTLIAGKKPAVMEKAKAIDNHPNDSRFKLEDDVVPTISARMGTGGNNGPMVMEPTEDKECIACIERNGTRPSHKGAGINNGDKSYTLNATEEHAVVAKDDSGKEAYSMTTGCFSQINKEKTATLAARDYKDPPIIAMSQNQREEVRDLGDKACAVTAEQGTHHQTFVAFHKKSHPKSKEEGQGWEETDVSDTLNLFDQGETRTPTLAVELGAESRVGGHTYEEVSGTLRAEMGDNQMSVVYGADQYNGNVEEEKEGTLGENCGMSSGRNAVVLNDQGGKSINVEEKDVSPTLRAEDHGHPPIVFGGQNGAQEGISASETVSPAIRANNIPDVSEQKVFGIGSKDSNAMKSKNPKSGIYEAETSKTLDLNGGNPACNQGGMAVVDKVFAVDQQGGKGYAHVTEDVSPTMEADGRMSHAVCYQDKKAYEKKDFAGKYEETEVSGSLRASGGDYGGGSENLVSDFIKENNENAPHQQDQLNDPNGISRTLAAGTHGSAPHLTKTLVPSKSGYTVRRLTPTECARLQGLPDYWVKDLADPNPSEEEIDKWYQIFEDFRNAITHGERPKSRESVRAFLQKPYSDSAAYKMFGNGIAVWCAVYVLAGISWAENDD